MPYHASSSSTTPPIKNAWLLFLTMATAATISAAAAAPQTYTIAGVYETKSESARTASLIDRDQTEIEKLLSQDLDNDDADWLFKAREIYEKGMHSGPYAKLTLTEPMQRDVQLPTNQLLPKQQQEEYYANSITKDDAKYTDYKLNVVGGNNAYEESIHGTMRIKGRTFGTGATTLAVLYPEGSTCNVDGNMNECLAGPDGGLVLQGYGAIDYTYDPHNDNKFTTSLKEFSEEEGLRMLYCENHKGCGAYQEYQHYYNYYGVLDYGHHWINAAFYKQPTSYSTKVNKNSKNNKNNNNNGNVDFSLFSNTARNEAIKTATVAMNVFTHINRLMVEMGIDGCLKNDKDFSSYGDSSAMDSVIAAWDTTVATYAGSALIASKSKSKSSMNEDENENENEYGSLYFNMVQSLANEFGVLEQFGVGYRSPVNWKIFDEFRKGRIGLTQGDCDGAVRHSYDTIVHLMRVPWIQGVLRAAFLLSSSSSGSASGSGSDNDATTIMEEERGRGAAYLAALLPDLHDCSPSAAKTVYDQLKIVDDNNNNNNDRSHRPDYEVVRNALEHQYECLSVTCDDVGGYLNSQTGGTSYFKATRPCGGYGKSIAQRRESVTYSKNAVAYNSRGESSSSSSSSSSSYGRNFLPAAFLMVVVVCCVSLAVLVVTINEHARRTGGQPILIPSGAGRSLFSAVSSQADYWMSSGSGSGSSSSRSNNRSMNLGSNITSSITNSISNNNNSDNNDYTASSFQEVQLHSMTSSPAAAAATERYFQIASDDDNNNNNNNNNNGGDDVDHDLL